MGRLFDPGPRLATADGVAFTFSLTDGGPAHRVLGRWQRSPVGFAGRVWLLGAVLWLPLAVATALEGTLGGGRGSFAEDWAVHLHLLVGLPLLLLAEPLVGRRLTMACADLEHVGLLSAEGAEAYERARRRAERLRDSVAAEVLLLAAAVALSWVELALGAHGWLRAPSGELSLAGWLHVAAGAPLHRFVGLRWFWRLLIWTVFLRGVSRADLRLLPAHPDGAAGLGELANAHLPFALVILAFGIDLAGGLTSQRLLMGGSVQDHARTALGFALLMPLPFLGPLTVFTLPLLQARRRWRVEYAATAADFVRRFHTRWLGPGATTLELESGATCAHIDMVSSFRVTEETRLAPFGRRHYLVLMFAGLIPMILFYMQEVPLFEILKGLNALAG
jgi:hypothetical protein